MEELHLIHIKSPSANYIGTGKDNTYSAPWYQSLEIPKNFRKTFHKDWLQVNKVPMVIYRKRRQPPINHRFELIDPSIESDKIPVKLTALHDNIEGYIIEEQFSHLRSLYSLVSDPQPEKLEEIAIIIDRVIEADAVPENVDFSFMAMKGKKEHKAVTIKDMRYQLIDQIELPPILLPLKPCALSSKLSYQIIRDYVCAHIDGRYAKITSNYDFCFTVKKSIKLNEPVAYQVDINWGHKRRKPKYETRYQLDREVEIFEMTHDEDRYREYTVLHGFTGISLEDLKNNIQSYLKNLIEKINEPVVDCPHCNGRGVIIGEKIEHPE